jgi:hypothetical protein
MRKSITEISPVQIDVNMKVRVVIQRLEADGWCLAS